MLVLFDIDGTLLTSQRAGTRSMQSAAREMLGEGISLETIKIAGRIDPLIWADIAVANGIEDPAARLEEFRTVYIRHLAQRLAEHQTVTPLPGVAPLLEQLSRIEGLALGLLTGNFPETGRMKLEAAGLDPQTFVVAAWGSDGSSRRDLPAVAISRLADATGRRVAGRDVVVIGDTPHDVDCARYNGCRAIAVSTGPFSRETLGRSEPDLLVEDLTRTGELVGWVTGRLE